VEQAQEDILVRRAQQGDRTAFMGLVEHYWGRLYRWLLGLTHCSHTAEDIAQDVLLRAWSMLGTFQAGTSFRAWLFRIGSNRFVDSKRGPRGKATRPLPPETTQHEPGPVGVVLAKECQAQVEQAIARLPLPLRSAFLLRTQEGMPFSEIAQTLGVTEETVRWRLFKARQQLLRDLREYLGPSSS
jgi:RNA polymerase sigma-70 factor (ECF subfamily)